MGQSLLNTQKLRNAAKQQRQKQQQIQIIEQELQRGESMWTKALTIALEK